MKFQLPGVVPVQLFQSCLTLCNPMDCSLPGSSVHGIFQARILKWVACPPPRDLPNPEIKPRSCALQADSLLSEPPGQPKNTGVGRLSLLQWIFLNRESNQILPCRRILYSLNCQGSLVRENLFTLGKEMATHSIILAWKIPWTEKPSRLQSMGLHRVRRD